MKIYKITKKEIMEVIQDDKWQEFRVSLKGLSTKEKLEKLASWYLKGKKAELQVINYYNALKRSGLIK